MPSADSFQRRPKALQKRLSKGSGYLTLLLLWGMILFSLQNPALSAKTVTDALKLCVGRVIPVLFPIAVAGGLLTSVSAVPRLLSGFWGRLLRLSAPSVGVVLISLVSGFPIGAMLASRLLESGRIDREEASRLASYTNNASGAFLTGCVGAAYFKDPRVGWILWIASSGAALTVGIRMGMRAVRSEHSSLLEQGETTPVSPVDSVKATALGMLHLTAFVTFFAVFCAFLNQSLLALLPKGRGTQTLCAAVIAFFEITGGLSAIATLPLHLLLRVGLAGLAIGFGGVSVIMQCIAAGKAVEGKRLLGARIRIGLLSAIYSILLTAIYVLS